MSTKTRGTIASKPERPDKWFEETMADNGFLPKVAEC